LKFGKKLFKYVRGIKSTFIGTNKKRLIKGNIYQIPWGLERTIISVSGTISMFVGRKENQT
jgi:hypothetical protein